MSLEEIQARALAAGAERTRQAQLAEQALQEQEAARAAQAKEAALGSEIATHQDKRAELYGKYQDRMRQLDQRKEQLAARRENRQRELVQIEEIRQSIGATETQLSSVPQTTEVVKGAGLSPEELDAALQEIAEEERNLSAERLRLQSQMETLQQQVEETNRQEVDVAGEAALVDKRSDHSPDLAAQQGPLSAEALAKITEQAWKDNEQVDVQRAKAELAKQLPSLEERQTNIKGQLEVLNKAFGIHDQWLEVNRSLADDPYNEQLRQREKDLQQQERTAFDAVDASQGSRMALDEMKNRAGNLLEQDRKITQQISEIRTKIE